MKIDDSCDVAHTVRDDGVGADMPERLRSELVERSATKSPWGTSAQFYKILWAI